MGSFSGHKNNPIVDIVEEQGNIVGSTMTCGTTNGSAEQPAEYSRVFVLCLSKMIQTNEKKTRTLVLRSIRNRSHRLVSLFLS